MNNLLRNKKMTYFVNDTRLKLTLLEFSCDSDASIFTAWANEVSGSQHIKTESTAYSRCSDSSLLNYYGFTIDSIVETLFESMPARSRTKSSQCVIKMLLMFPELSKSHCCQMSGKEPTHYSRISKSLGKQCRVIGALTGGRNPLKLLRGIRSDI